jgi:Ca-activated chloride channel homolog
MNTNDSHETISPADPRITAYAFGELEGDELKLIEAAVNADPALQAAVAELRGFGGQLATALGDELGGADPVAKPAPKKRSGLVIPFPLHYFATAAAACFAVVVWVRHETIKPAESIQEMPSERVSAPETAMSSVVDAAALKSVPEPATLPPVAMAAAALPETPVAEVKFDQTLALGGTTGVGLAKNEFSDGDARIVQAAPAAPQVSKQFIQERKEIEKLIAKGRSQYLSGDSDAAQQTFRSVEAVDVGNPVAKSFIARIDYEKAAVSELNRVKTRGQMLEEVTSSWQRPTGYQSGSLASAAAIVAPEAESYAHTNDNAYHVATVDPLSTFSIDVDTASYSNVRRFLTSGRLPPRDAVRVEELINYFPYRYTPPTGDVPFSAKLEVASAPWAPEHRLVRIGLKGRELTAASRPPANLVFLIDVSGSMSAANKLPLVKESLRLLVERLRPDDRVAIVTYAGNSGLALPSTPASRKNEILASLDNLDSGGSTNGAMGIHLAYDIAKANFVTNGGINRVILCTDGDFNVGVTNHNELVSLIEEKAKSRVFLSIFGFGMGNLKDSTLEALSGKGNGTYGYIDNRREAEKIFVEQVEGTLATIAKDVKIQVEFNPAKVASYRLIGYENRILAKEDFNNDAVDAGDIGAGHTVTALYEIVPVGVDSDGSERPSVDPLKYQKTPGNVRKPATNTTGSRELLTVKIRYKAPEGDVSKKQEFPLVDAGAGFAKADGEFRFAAAVAAWGMLLRDSPHKGSATFEQVLAWAEDGLGDDTGGHRAEFIQLVRKSAELGR